MADRDLLRQQLYDQLMQRTNPQDEEMEQAGEAHRLGALASSLSRSTGMIGQVGGKPVQQDTSVGDLNDSLYRGAQTDYSKNLLADDKRDRLKLELAKSLEEKRAKLTPIPGAVGENNQPAFLDENNEVKYLPGLKQKTPQTQGAGNYSIVPGFEGAAPDDVLIKGPNGLQKGKLPPGFKPKEKARDAKLTEDERKRGMQVNIALNELKTLEDMENGTGAHKEKYRPGGREILAAGASAILPGKLGSIAANNVRGAADRQYDSAVSRLIDPFLRATTGAGVTRQEVEEKLKGYAIVPGDDEEQIRIKQKARRDFINGLIESAGRASKGRTIEGSDLSPEDQQELEDLEKEFGGQQ